MTYEEKIKKEQEVRLGQLNDEWFEKIGKDFLEREKTQVLNDLSTAMPTDLIMVQAKYKAILDLARRLKNISNDKNSAYRKLQEENRRE